MTATGRPQRCSARRGTDAPGRLALESYSKQRTVTVTPQERVNRDLGRPTTDGRQRAAPRREPGRGAT